jgi:hypothetical protein
LTDRTTRPAVLVAAVAAVLLYAPVVQGDGINPKLLTVIVDRQGPRGNHGHEYSYEGFTLENVGTRPLGAFVATFNLDDATIRVRRPAQWNPHGLGRAAIKVVKGGRRLVMRVTSLRSKSYLLVRASVVLGGPRGRKCDSATLEFPATASSRARRFEYRYPCYMQFGN